MSTIVNYNYLLNIALYGIDMINLPHFKICSYFFINAWITVW